MIKLLLDKQIFASLTPTLLVWNFPKIFFFEPFPYAKVLLKTFLGMHFSMNLAALIVGILTVVVSVDDVSAEVNVGKLSIKNIQ